jgi:hypothetical protein
MVESLFREGEKMEHSYLAPSNIVQFRREGNTAKPEFNEPFTATKATTFEGVAMIRRERAREFAKLGNGSASKVELSHADTIEGTLNFVKRSHARETMTAAEIRESMQDMASYASRQQTTEDLEADSPDAAERTNKQQADVKDQLMKACEKVALSHHFFALQDEGRLERKAEFEKAESDARSKEQEWMQRHT